MASAMNCDLCGSSNRIPLPQERRISVCAACGFIYVPVRRSTAEVAADWSRIYREKVYDPSWPGCLARLWYVAEWFQQHYGWEGKSLLDIGAGAGSFLSFARDRGAHAVGLEPDAENVARIKAQDIACFHNTVEGAGRHIGTYDVISILWTLENTADCMGMLRFAKEHLNPNGHLIVATGSRILVPFKKRLSEYLPAREREVDTHCYRWTYDSLQTALWNVNLSCALWNDWEQNDTMIVVADHPPPDIKFIPGATRDDPADILEFFAAWQKFFP